MQRNRRRPKEFSQMSNGGELSSDCRQFKRTVIAVNLQTRISQQVFFYRLKCTLSTN